MMDDLISRQAAIDALKRISFSYYFECGEYLSEDTREIEIINSNKALEAIKALPSAQPERKEAKWIRWWEVKDDGFGGEIHTPHWKCGECGTEYSPHLTSSVRYCVNCGVELEDEE